MNNPIRPENKDVKETAVATDTTEIVRRHLEDENHTITDEEIRNIRVVGEDDEPVTTGAEAEARFVDNKADNDSSEEDDLSNENEGSGTP